jgi:hypothetical protein
MPSIKEYTHIGSKILYQKITDGPSGAVEVALSAGANPTYDLQLQHRFLTAQQIALCVFFKTNVLF